MNTSENDVTIVGGGAAGLAAAIFAAQTARSEGRSSRVVVLDGAAKLGAKILVSGGGRCNVTHHRVTPEDFNGSKNIVRNILAAFDVEQTIEWFKSLGVELKREETGKLFPTTNSAHTVLDSLLRRCNELNIVIQTNFKVTSIAPQAHGSAVGSGYRINESIDTKRLILATGGKSLPKSGSDGSGWTLASALGHTITPTFTALVPLVLDPRMFHAELSGVSHEVELTTLVDKKPIDRRRGSLLWTHFGISGPVVMDASRYWVIAKETSRDPQLVCNLLPDETFESIERWLIDSANSKSTIVNRLSQRLPERVVNAIFRFVDINPLVTGSQLSRDARRALAHATVSLPLPVLNARGWNYAEVTAGGVPLSEVDFRSMESRRRPSLYLVGEILDCDGRIGGFNFQWAWATGFLAGRAAGSGT